MIDSGRCPSCESSDLSVIRKYTFKKPVETSYHRIQSFSGRRLWILFSTIAKEADSLDVKVVHCRACDLLSLSPRLTNEEITAKYEMLTRMESTKIEYSKHPVFYADERAHRIYSLLSPFIAVKNKEPKVVVDYGGQFGHNLKMFPRDRFRKLIVDFERYDLYDDVDYVGSDMNDIPNGSCTVILANHIVEHMNFPGVILKTVSEKLSPGGILYVEVPCGSFREAYHVREPITHLNFFSEKSLYNLMEMLGLSVMHLSTDFQWITVNNEWCINIVGQKRDTIHHELARPPRSSADMRGKIDFYMMVIYERILFRLLKRSLFRPKEFRMTKVGMRNEPV